MPSRIFLLSPAHCGGKRAGILMREGSTLPIAARLHGGTLSLGDAFAFMSGLYFRGKLAYAKAFGRSSDATIDPVLVITPTRGLMPAATLISIDLLHEFASVDIASGGEKYLEPLERDLSLLVGRLVGDEWVVLLGSLATGKYTDVLTRWLAERLRYPVSFAGRGDMSRGGLLLRSAAANQELDYEVLRAGVRPRWPRPPRLPPLS